MKNLMKCCIPFLLLIFFGCHDIFEPQDAPQAGYGRAVITVNGMPVRTVFPSTTFARYEYFFAKVINDELRQGCHYSKRNACADSVSLNNVCQI